MSENQQALALLLILGLGAAAVVLMSRPPQGLRAYGAPPEPVPTQARARSRYQNEERTEIRRDKSGRITELVVHRDAQVA